MENNPSCSSESNLVFIGSQKSKPALLADGYRYNQIIINKGGSSRWRCANRTDCSATITINKDQNRILRPAEHTCKQNVTKNKIDAVMDKCKKSVCKKYTPVQRIFEKKFSEIDDEFVPNFNSKKDTLRRTRRNFLKQQRTEVTNLNDVQVPEILAKDFLLCEDGTDDNKILIFCPMTIRSNIKTLNNNLFFIDGTFTRTPKPFYQIISIHVNLSSSSESVHVVGAIYALLPNKLQHTYERLFELLKQHLELNIKNIKCDYEVGLSNALKHSFPQINVSGCYFHYNKAVWKKAEILKATDSKEAKDVIRMCANFPLLPADCYSDCWAYIKEHAGNNDKMQSFLNYFEKQWLKPTMHISCYNDIFRTNNPLEGWNRRFNLKVNRKPTLILFIDALRKEAKWQEIRYKNTLFHGSKRRKIDISFNIRYAEEKKKLEENRTTPYEFLKRISYIKRILNV